MSSPPVTMEEAQEVAKTLFGINVVAVKSLGSCQDANFRVSDAHHKYVLKFSNTETSLEEIVFQNHVLEHLGTYKDSLNTAFPSVFHATSAECGFGVTKVALHGTEYFVRLLSYIDGDLYSDYKYKSRDNLRSFGLFISNLNAAFSKYSGMVANREVEWDMKYAMRNIREFSSFVSEETEKKHLVTIAEKMQAIIDANASQFRSQIIHGDLAHYNLIASRLPNKQSVISGVIDFGDVTQGWLVGDIAVAVCPLFLDGDLTCVEITTDILRGFLEGNIPLNNAEVHSLWPLIVLRAIMLYVFITKQTKCDPENQYCLDELVQNRVLLNRVLAVPHCFATEAILQAAKSPHSLAAADPLRAGSHQLFSNGEETFQSLDLSVESLDYPVEGGWLGSRLDDFIQQQINKLQSHSGLFVDYGVPVLLNTQLRSHEAPATVTLGSTIYFPSAKEVEITAPFDCEVIPVSNSNVVEMTKLEIGWTGGPHYLVLRGTSTSLLLRGVSAVNCSSRFNLAAGASCRVTVHSPVTSDHIQASFAAFHVQVIPADIAAALVASVKVTLPPMYCSSHDYQVWQALCPDPTPLLGIVEGVVTRKQHIRSEQQIVDKRYAYFANVQEHYFKKTVLPLMVRGHKQFMYDQYGRAYLDMVNNVAVAGHSRAKIINAATKQLHLLNTNSRFVYEALGNYTEKIISHIPKEIRDQNQLNVVFLVNSGSEATDLALRLARTVVTERRKRDTKSDDSQVHQLNRDTVCLVGAYHGVTTASDEVSTTLNDNPRSLETRAPWIHLVSMPNLYRGQYQCEAYGRATDLPAEAVTAAYQQAAAQYADLVDQKIDALVASHKAPAVFIAEPLSGNAGGVEIPPGFLQRVYQKMRSVGGLCIADEVQVGYGRLGSHFWGFQEHGVVPDIITMAKAAGNGHPLGFVITSQKIAEEFGADGSFFSSAGGGPVSCEVGMAVLDLLAEERLQQNAHDVGAYLNGKLKELQKKYPEDIGCIHGHGLYQGVELITDSVSKAPATAAAYVVCERLLALGVICHNTGDYSNVLKVKPPLCFAREDADFFVSALDRVFSNGW